MDELSRRPGLVRPVRVDPFGLAGPTRGRARGPQWRTTSRGLFVPADVERSVEQRIVEAAAVLRRDEAVTGWAALRWQRAEWFDGLSGSAPREVPLVTTRDRTAQAGMRVSQEFLHPDEIATVDGLPVTLSVRSAAYEMRYASTLGEAIVALDMACYADHVSLAEVAAYLAGLGPVTGIQQARDALAEGEENSWSPQETRMRGVWTRRAGLPRPLCNAPVFTLDGRHVGTPDLVDPETGLAGQYNGSDHLSLVGAATDVKQEAAYRDLGLETVTMLATDWRDLDGFVERLHAAARRARSGPRSRAWTVDPPDWWTPTNTVARRRALDAAQRARLLRYRRAA
ncbi:hypothetical protein ASC64_12325 [Nocardioides sp. Root122]|uniref:hypothetical protein n=1 Tax=Nocardioides TaxID=1839 RepID=UPI00070377CF|nr:MULTISPECIES: hypothetical protein [Nocardioides]KQV67959.1 hypothetical protein ASC64_12325 [Nocardioides sp. Root122]MCK9823918.1 hypothetical protein [Nocardioides cavernae]